ncbi:MAG: hypothetical protein DA408_17640 [Bacteroidetes bacterium]|nr:MAG: hypothetical protein C7N36_19265 [Bacteroidota bacterium]PTM09743.1 MAG: hypothetical protein DA408_17640 [Bacteroidota bacterium]
MSIQQEYRFGSNNNSNSPFSGLVGVLVAVLFFVGLFYFMQFLFKILWLVMPVVVIATAIIDHKVILGYFGWLGRMFRSNWVAGLAVTALTMIGAPVVAVFLLGKALLKKKIKTVQDDAERQEQGEFVEYEEIDSEFLNLPPLEPRKPTPPKENNGYDDMFKGG